MACSSECFKEYMNRIEKSRNLNIQTDVSLENKKEDIIPKNKKPKKFVNQEMISENIIIEN